MPSDLDSELWIHAKALVERCVSTANRDVFLDETLDHLVQVLGADRGLILLADETGATVVVNARGRGRALAVHEREEISRTLVRQVQERGQPLFWEPAGDPIGTAAAPGSMLSLGIVAAMVAPLRPIPLSPGARGEYGVIYVDVRDSRSTVSRRHLELVTLAAHLISVVLERTQELEVVRAELRDALARSDTPPPRLHDLLRPRSMDDVRREIELCLDSDMPIVLLGESGTGKTLIARAIAEASGKTPIVRAMLGQADDLNTITSELFGHEHGSYSGALARRVGLVEYANGGTLILDEILNLPPHAQQLLLDFTQFGTYRPLGWPKAEPKHSRTRVIAVTNGDLLAAIEAGKFRSDLYFRLATVTITLPPLRARREDIPALAEAVLRRVDPARAMTLSVDARRLLLADTVSWPGNHRQLEAVIQRARLRALAADRNSTQIDVAHIDARDLGVERTSLPAAAHDLGARWRELAAQEADLAARQDELIDQALARHGNVVARAAQELGLPRTSLISRMQARSKHR